jgi:hypothetical protein
MSTDSTQPHNADVETTQLNNLLTHPVEEPLVESNRPAREMSADEAQRSEDQTPAPPVPSQAVVPAQKDSMRTILKFAPEDEPYVAGQCTIAIALTLQPDTGHGDGRQVLIGVRSHDETPLIGLARLNSLQLPGEIITLLEKYELELPARGQAKAEELAQEEARKRDEETKRKEAEAKRKARASSKAKSAPPEQATTPQPAPPAAGTTVAQEANPDAVSQISLFG